MYNLWVFLFSYPNSLSSPRSSPTTLASLAFAPLGSSEAPNATKWPFPSGQQCLTVTWPDVWARTAMPDRMFSPTLLVYSAYDRFINSNAVQVALPMVLHVIGPI